MCSHMLRDRLFVSSSITRLCVVTVIKTIKILCSKQKKGFTKGYRFSGSAVVVVFLWLHVFGSLPIKTQKLQANDTASLSRESPVHGNKKKTQWWNYSGSLLALQKCSMASKNPANPMKKIFGKLNFNLPKI